MKKKLRNRYLIVATACLLAIFALIYYYFFASFSRHEGTDFVYIDTDDNIDSVTTKLQSIAKTHTMHAFTTLARHTSYADNIKTGRYAVSPGDGALTVFRHLKNGMQTPTNLTIPSVRTMEKLAAVLGQKLMIDSTEIINALKDENICKSYGLDTLNIACLFIPNTYDVYWNVSLKNLLDRMKKENDNFWNDDRTAKASAAGLSKTQVITLASIVDEETANDKEKPMIAEMYLNRLKYRNAEYPEGMPLQADPTVKYALKKFELRRIYRNMLLIDSPYNTYRYAGLPPGPIRIPTVAGIDAVLNHADHDYLYMCAKEDFSGTHNFARTYQEHLQNAAKYSKALNARGIK